MFEHDLVKRFRASLAWHAERLGGSSTGLPDIVAVNNNESIILAIEAKSGSTDYLYVPSDQITRCMNILRMFSVYQTKLGILAFKFISKKWKNKGIYAFRPIKEYVKVVNQVFDDSTMPTVRCTYDGETTVIVGKESTPITFPDFNMEPLNYNIKLLKKTHSVRTFTL